MANPRGNQSKVTLMLEGPMNQCTISVMAGPNQRIRFYAGNAGGNWMQMLIADAHGKALETMTGQDGVGLIPKHDLCKYEGLSDFNSITAVTVDGKQSLPTQLPLTDLPGIKPAQGKNLSISPEDAVILKYQKNEYPIEILTFTEPKKPGPRDVVFGSDGPVTILDANGNSVAVSVCRWEFKTNADGTYFHTVKPLGTTIMGIWYHLKGDTEKLKRKLEFA